MSYNNLWETSVSHKNCPPAIFYSLIICCIIHRHSISFHFHTLLCGGNQKSLCHLKLVQNAAAGLLTSLTDDIASVPASLCCAIVFLKILLISYKPHFRWPPSYINDMLTAGYAGLCWSFSLPWIAFCFWFVVRPLCKAGFKDAI